MRTHFISRTWKKSNDQQTNLIKYLLFKGALDFSKVKDSPDKTFYIFYPYMKIVANKIHLCFQIVIYHY